MFSNEGSSDIDDRSLTKPPLLIIITNKMSIKKQNVLKNIFCQYPIRYSKLNMVINESFLTFPNNFKEY